jgi:hypothetical protein
MDWRVGENSAYAVLSGEKLDRDAKASGFPGRDLRRVFLRGELCPHSSSTFFDGSVLIASSGRAAAFTARIIKSACVVAQHLNTIRTPCAEPERWFCLLARCVGSRAAAGHSCSPALVEIFFPWIQRKPPKGRSFGLKAIACTNHAAVIRPSFPWHPGQVFPGGMPLSTACLH